MNLTDDLTMYYAISGVSGHEDEELGTEPHHTSHRHCPEPHRRHCQWSVRCWQADHLLISKMISRPFSYSFSTGHLYWKLIARGAIMHQANRYEFSLQMVLSFEMPFALIPLLKFCNSSKKVGPLKESIYVIKLPYTDIPENCSPVHFPDKMMNNYNFNYGCRRW